MTDRHTDRQKHRQTHTQTDRQTHTHTDRHLHSLIHTYLPVSVQVVVQALVRTAPSVFDSLLVSLMVCLIFSYMGVSMFAGKFFYCFNETSEEMFLSDDVNNKSDCVFLILENYTEVRWKNVKPNFDHVGNGYLTLFQLVSVNTLHAHTQ